MNKTSVMVYIALFLIPLLPLLLTWQRALTRRDALAMSSTITVKLPLAATTGSCLLFFANLLFEPTTGVHYSDARFVMIVVAFVVSLGMVILSLLGKHALRWPLAATSAAVTTVWLYLWAMSAVV